MATLSGEPQGWGWLIKEELWWDKSLPALHSVGSDIFRALDLFQNSANVHRLERGAPHMSERLILCQAIAETEKLLEKLKYRKQDFDKRLDVYNNIPSLRKAAKVLWMKEHVDIPKKDRKNMWNSSNRQKQMYFSRAKAEFIEKSRIVCMKNMRCPEVVSNMVMSYLPASVRLENLRLKYTNEFLISGLSKKTVIKLKFIYKNFVAVIKTHCAWLDQNKKNLCGLDVTDNEPMFDSLTQFNGPWEFLDTKQEKVEFIFEMYRNIERFAFDGIIHFDIYDELCSRVISILNLLVIIVKNPKAARVKK